VQRPQSAINKKSSTPDMRAKCLLELEKLTKIKNEKVINKLQHVEERLREKKEAENEKRLTEQLALKLKLKEAQLRRGKNIVQI
jgi:hypothetical protein